MFQMSSFDIQLMFQRPGYPTAVPELLLGCSEEFLSNVAWESKKLPRAEKCLEF
jgi:hypothetical protein